MRIAIVNANMTAGGAERVIEIMTRYWVERSHVVTLITLSSADDAPFYDLHVDVRYEPLDLLASRTTLIQAVWRNIVRIKTLRRALQKARPDVVVSFVDRMNVLALAATIGTGIPVIAAERIDPRASDIGRQWSLLRRLLYPRAAAVTVQTGAAAAYFSRRIQRHLSIIPNPVPAISAPGNESLDYRAAASQRTLVGIGRLVEQKGFDRLIEAFSRVAPAHRNWVLEIWGEGELGHDLRAQAARCGVGDRVHLRGATRDIVSVLRAADVFALSSRYEGFPNVLVEAMSVGLPVVSFDCPSGPSDIISHGINGLLVPNGDTSLFAGALNQLMGDSEERSRLGQAALAVVTQFSVERVMQQWDSLIEDVVASR